MTLVVASMVDGLISANHAMTVCQTTAIPETTLLLLPLVAIGSRQSHVVSWARTSGFSPPGSSNSERQPVAGGLVWASHIDDLAFAYPQACCCSEEGARSCGAVCARPRHQTVGSGYGARPLPEWLYLQRPSGAQESNVVFVDLRSTRDASSGASHSGRTGPGSTWVRNVKGCPGYALAKAACP